MEMGSYLESSLQVLLILVLAVTAGIAFRTITIMIELRRWNTVMISLAVKVGFLLIGGAGIFSQMNPVYRERMILGAFLTFFGFTPVAAIGSYIGLKVFLLTRYADLLTSEEESSQIIITQPIPAQRKPLPTTIVQTLSTPTAAPRENTSQRDTPQPEEVRKSRKLAGSYLKKLGQQETLLTFRHARQL